MKTSNKLLEELLTAYLKGGEDYQNFVNENVTPELRPTVTYVLSELDTDVTKTVAQLKRDFFYKFKEVI